MKYLVALIFALLPLTAFGNQTIYCNEFNKDGSVSKRGILLTVDLIYLEDGKVDQENTQIFMKNVWKRDSNLGQNFSSISTQQSQPRSKSTYAIVFFNDDASGQMVEYQLQFEEAVLEQDFSDVEATLVIGIEETSSEAMPSWGYDITCSGEVK